MSCDYFILTKPNTKPVNDNSSNQILYLNNLNHYILPQSNIEYYMKYGLFEANLIDWSSQFCSKDKVMLDIGSHSGTYSIALSNQCKTVYSFEPQMMTYYALCGSVALSNIKNIKCINYGLGSPEQVGSKDLYIVSNDGGGSTVVLDTNDNSKTILATETIEIRTLDSFNIDNIGFIKMDVEENELNVLMGSIDTLKKSNYPKILFEANNISNIDSKSELFNFLKKISYNIVSISGVSNMFLASH